MPIRETFRRYVILVGEKNYVLTKKCALYGIWKTIECILSLLVRKWSTVSRLLFEDNYRKTSHCLITHKVDPRVRRHKIEKKNFAFTCTKQDGNFILSKIKQSETLHFLNVCKVKVCHVGDRQSERKSTLSKIKLKKRNSTLPSNTALQYIVWAEMDWIFYIPCLRHGRMTHNQAYLTFALSS